MPRRHEPYAPQDPNVHDEATFIVRRIGPETYSFVLEVEGKAVMLAADYFKGPDEVEAAVLWLKRHAPRAAVIWRD
jgi:hypothetical protein